VKRSGWAGRSLLAAAGVAALALQGCELAVLGAAGTAAYSISEDRRTSGTQMDDETIAPRSQSRIYDRFPSNVHVTSTSFNRVVLLTGEAPDEATRQEIAKIVLGVPGVRAVTNEIQLAPPTTRSSRINDEYITVKLKSRLLGSSRVSLVHAKTVVEDGVVYLLGLVTEQEAEEAVEIARTIDGVRKVVKIFEYCKPSDEVCRPAPPPQEMPNRRANAPAQGS
jgi:osmotically-inducible protein OsmY